MARRLRAASLSLKLEVIVEEDLETQFNNLRLTPNHQPSNPLATPNSTTCTITIRNRDRSDANDPQFLHTGKWPTMDMVEHAWGSPIESLEGYKVSSITSSERPTTQIPTDKATSSITHIESWGIVDAEQLSMVMDHWRPSDCLYPSLESAPSLASGTYDTVSAVQQDLFLREVGEECMIRAAAVEHIEELEDNDSAIEIVATLEGYRQHGWAEEMIKAFPRECWLIWVSSGMGQMIQFEHTDSCKMVTF